MTAAAVKLDDMGDDGFADELKPGTQLLMGQFTIESFLSSGGFGITYLARDSLDRTVVIKECFPSSFCRRTDTIVGPRTRARQDEFRSVVKLFLQEALHLSKLDHPHIVKVHQVFEDNETAYMAMDYIQGPDMLQTLEGTAPTLTPVQIATLLMKMLDAVGYVHDQGMLHRDISPDNILLDKFTGDPVLIDFGASRKEVTRKSRVLSGLRVVKDGYSPQEFYISGSKQAPCSDLYALAATFHHLIAGETPKASQERLSAIANKEADPHRPLAGRVKGYPEVFLRAIDKAMAIFPRDRIQSVSEWTALLHDMPAFEVKAPAAVRVPSAQPLSAKSEAVVSTPVQSKPAVSAPAPVASRSLTASPQAVVAARGSHDLMMTAAAAMLLLSALLSLPGDILQRFGWGGDASVSVASATVVAPAAAGMDLPDGLRMVRTVRLPFVPSADDATLVMGVLQGSPGWMRPGQRLVEVNGAPVQDGADLQAMMGKDADLGSIEALKVILGYETHPGSDIVRKVENLAVVDQLRLENGMAFEMQVTPTGIQTVVAALPEGAASDLKIGDVLLVYTATGETIGTGTALAEILAREMLKKVATYGFAVQRDGNMAEASFRLPGSP